MKLFNYSFDNFKPYEIFKLDYHLTSSLPQCENFIVHTAPYKKWHLKINFYFQILILEILNFVNE